jgi:N-acetylneuraminate synthase
MSTITFRNGRKVGEGEAPYIIAELNTSHFGKVDLAKEMIQSAKEIGADCVKFQSWTDETLYSKSYYDANPIAQRFVKRYSLSEDELGELVEYCGEIGIDFSSTPYSENEVDFLVEKTDAPFIKIASMELNNLPFLKYIGSKGMPVILSTGMGSMEEIERAVQTIESTGNTQIVILHCISIYPADPEITNLRNITSLKSYSQVM